MKNKCWIYLSFSFFMSCSSSNNSLEKNYDSISGIYPRLAYYNDEGECGTGAVVPWADRLWVITYGPHLPDGSSDKLYEITPDLKQHVFPNSIGGTPANRMIHKESNQLFIGPYVIDSIGNVRVIPYSKMPGRHTGNARHLTDPANKVYYATMEEGFYAVDVKTLDVDTIYIDGNKIPKKKGELSQANALLPGSHGKGFYSGQGVVVYSNNGEATYEALHKFDVEAGVLAEWDGKDWRVVRRNQFTEVTGPGGIYGNSNPATDPIWSTGWDHKSVILGVREPDKGWSFYRLPKASHSYDGAHGWNTEWPRIRCVGNTTDDEYLMTMHGMFWRFPKTFTSEHSAGIRPRSAYLKVIGDFTRWNDKLVFGCDDSAQKEFLNKRKAKGGIEGPGQSNSNLWFTDISTPDKLGPAYAEGAVWMDELVEAETPSEPFLFAGWNKRCAWIKNNGDKNVVLTFEIDKYGNNNWIELKEIEVAAGKSLFLPFTVDENGEWIRVKSSQSTNMTVCFSYGTDDKRTTVPDKIFDGLSLIGEKADKGGLLYALGNNRRSLGILSNKTYSAYYEMGESFNLQNINDSTTVDYMINKYSIPKKVVQIEKGSVLVIDDKQRRWRLPLGDSSYKTLMDNGELRVCREVATERDLFSCMGTFYELPAENADGFAKIRPISSHNFQINDYASYRGMLVMTGVNSERSSHNNHIVTSQDGKAAIWTGVIDDLWKMGKPVGIGGPWCNSDVKANVPSDPYLIAYYDKKSMVISHKLSEAISIKVEVDPTGNGDWMEYMTLDIAPHKMISYDFPESFQGRWIRFVSDKDANVNVSLVYE